MIKVKNVTFSVYGNKIINGITYKFNNTGFYALLGHSGCGKTTFLKLLSGFNQPSSGEVIYEEEIYAGYVPQDDIVYPTLSVFDNLYYIYLMTNPNCSENDAEKEVTKLIAAMGLLDHKKRKVKKLSGGQRKRVNIARAMLGNPNVVFLDEPTSGLDPKSEHSIMNYLKKLSETKLIILTTHIMESISLLDQVLVLSDGRIVFYGSSKNAEIFFGVKEFSKIYDILAAKKSSDILAKFNKFRKKYE